MTAHTKTSLTARGRLVFGASSILIFIIAITAWAIPMRQAAIDHCNDRCFPNAAHTVDPCTCDLTTFQVIPPEEYEAALRRAFRVQLADQ